MILFVSAIYWGAIHGMSLRGLRRPMTRIELGRSLRAHARPDRRRLRRRALLLAARLQRPGHLAPRLGPARATAATCSAARTPAIDYSVVSATAIWYVQVAALVTGHVIALVLGHDRALALYEDPKEATRSQIVMLVLMVCFTCLGLWLLSAANG